MFYTNFLLVLETTWLFVMDFKSSYVSCFLVFIFFLESRCLICIVNQFARLFLNKYLSLSHVLQKSWALRSKHSLYIFWTVHLFSLLTSFKWSKHNCVPVGCPFSLSLLDGKASYKLISWISELNLEPSLYYIFRLSCTYWNWISCLRLGFSFQFLRPRIWICFFLIYKVDENIPITSR